MIAVRICKTCGKAFDAEVGSKYSSCKPCNDMLRENNLHIDEFKNMRQKDPDEEIPLKIFFTQDETNDMPNISEDDYDAINKLLNSLEDSDYIV